MRQESYITPLGSKTLTATFTDLADQATGSVLMRYGNTTALITAVMGSKARSDINYMPLSVEYEERFYAAGEILGSRFIRREGKPSDDAILSARVVDRTIRPLFNKNLRADVQVVVTVLSIDEDDPDVLAVNGASIALACSAIPWNGPVSAVRIGKKKDAENFVINPTYEFRTAHDTELDLLLCGNDSSETGEIVITMIEMGGKEVSEEVLMKALWVGIPEIEKLQTFQKELIKKIAPEKVVLQKELDLTHVAEVFTAFEHDFEKALFPESKSETPLSLLKSRYLEAVIEKEGDARIADTYFEEKVGMLMRRKAIASGARVDGRAPDAIRPLFAQAGGMSDILHGSGIFFRGGTHILSVLTLGGPDDSQIIDSIEGVEIKKRFMHHYNFPPFSVGDTGKMGGLNRRMIGHGALAEKALEPVIPDEHTFPYTIRLVSEALASNGSTSMASVCASSLALMDGGVPITRPVAGIAIGVMYESPNKYRILTDIQGLEDHHGDMDFKVAGTEQGITAIQLDVKVSGLPLNVILEALEDAKKARMTILKTMASALNAPRDTLSVRVPHIETITIPKEMIGMVIGASGKNIKKIKEEAGVSAITVEDTGLVYITGALENTSRARNIIEDITRTFKEGDVVTGVVVRITNFGAFIQLSTRTDGLLHISEIAPYRIERVEEVLSVGETVTTIVKSVDDSGKVSLSLRAHDPEFAKKRGVHAQKSDVG